MKVLAIDHGARRVGYATSDSDGVTAFPGGVISWRNERDLLKEIARVAEEKEVDKIVVGLPIRLSGEVGPAAQKVLDFVEKLRAALATPVETFDERLSTVRAQRSMLGADLSRAKRAKRVDAVAAAVFLQTYLDCQRSHKETDP